MQVASASATLDAKAEELRSRAAALETRAATAEAAATELRAALDELGAAAELDRTTNAERLAQTTEKLETQDAENKAAAEVVCGPHSPRLCSWCSSRS